MKKKDPVLLDFVIDKLTNSIQNTISGDSFETEIQRLTIKDLKKIKNETGGVLIGNQN